MFSDSSPATLNIIAPLGISFIVFQIISILIDCYRGTVKDLTLIDVMFYISFFPKIISGPITRYSDLKKSISKNKFDIDLIEKGIFRFSIGFAKKQIIADTLGYTVDKIFDLQEFGITSTTAWLAMFLYTFQIYFDFSGYSDMAIGLGQLFGYKLCENFDLPYAATSIQEFWRKWHISLSSWFRDYLYFPLRGSKTGNVYLNTAIVFLATGIWHGANWTFIIWGLIHGISVMFEKLLQQKSLINKIPKLLRWCYTMFIVSIGWLLFRSPDLDFFKEQIKIMLGIKQFAVIEMSTIFFLSPKVLVTMVLAILISFPSIKFLTNLIKNKVPSSFFKLIKYSFSLILLLIGILYMVNSTYSPFIYYQF